MGTYIYHAFKLAQFSITKSVIFLNSKQFLTLNVSEVLLISHLGVREFNIVLYNVCGKIRFLMQLFCAIQTPSVCKIRGQFHRAAQQKKIS